MRLARRSTPPAVPTPRGLVREEDHRLPASTDAEQQFSAAYEKMFPRLCEVVSYYLPADDPRDIVHDAMADIWRRWSELAPLRPGPGYFVRAVLNQVLLTKRRWRFDRLRAQRYALDLETHGRVSKTADADAEIAALLAAARAAVAALPPRCMAVWLAIREQQLSYAQAAEALGIELSTVKSHMSKAQQDVRAALIAAGYDLHRRLVGSSQPTLLPETTTIDEGDAHD